MVWNLCCVFGWLKGLFFGEVNIGFFGVLLMVILIRVFVVFVGKWFESFSIEFLLDVFMLVNYLSGMLYLSNWLLLKLLNISGFFICVCWDLVFIFI